MTEQSHAGGLRGPRQAGRAQVGRAYSGDGRARQGCRPYKAGHGAARGARAGEGDDRGAAPQAPPGRALPADGLPPGSAAPRTPAARDRAAAGDDRGGEVAARARGREEEAAPDGRGHLLEARGQPSEDAVGYCDGTLGQVAALSAAAHRELVCTGCPTRCEPHFACDFFFLSDVFPSAFAGLLDESSRARIKTVSFFIRFDALAPSQAVLSRLAPLPCICTRFFLSESLGLRVLVLSHCVFLCIPSRVLHLCARACVACVLRSWARAPRAA